jgi:tetratricopeptide (TPR) repeat protein
MIGVTTPRRRAILSETRVRRMLSDRLAIARCLHNLANVVEVLGDYPLARWALGEATGIFEELVDRSGAAWSINQQGDIERAAGDLAAARGLYERALSAFREAGDPLGVRAVANRFGLHRL